MAPSASCFRSRTERPLTETVRPSSPSLALDFATIGLCTMLLLAVAPMFLVEAGVAPTVFGYGILAFLGNAYLPPMIGTWRIALDPETARFLPEGVMLRSSRLHKTRALHLWLWRAIIIHVSDLKLKPKHVAQLINHEAVHFQHRDGLAFILLLGLFYLLGVSALALGLATLALLFVPELQSAVPFGRGGFAAGMFGGLAVLGALLFLWVRWTLHGREFRADRRAYARGGADYLALLSLLDRRSKVQGTRKALPLLRRLRKLQARLTHPSFAARMARLERDEPPPNSMVSGMSVGLILALYLFLGERVVEPPEPGFAGDTFNYRHWMSSTDGTVPDLALMAGFLFLIIAATCCILPLTSIQAHALVLTHRRSLGAAAGYSVAFGAVFIAVTTLTTTDPVWFLSRLLTLEGMILFAEEALKFGSYAAGAYFLNYALIRWMGIKTYSVFPHLLIGILSLAFLAIGRIALSAIFLHF